MGLLLLCSCRGGWTTVAPHEAGFTVAMPGTVICGPRFHEETSKGRLTGRYCKVDVVSLLAPFVLRFSTSYVVSWFDLPSGLGEKDIEVVLQELEDAALRGGVAIERRPAVLGGVAARDLEAKFPIGDGSHHYAIRQLACVSHGRLFRLSAQGDPSAMHGHRWQRIAESFQLVALPGAPH